MNNKTIASHRQQNNRPKPFQNSWSITYKKPNYTALNDPHASYYFLNKSVHKHLFSLRKSIQKQGAFTQKKSMRYLINQKIKDYNNVNMTKMQANYNKNMKSSPSISSIRSGRSRSSLLNEENNDKKQKKKKNKQKSINQTSQTIDVTNQNKQQRRHSFGLPKIRTRNKTKQKTVENEQKEKSLMEQQSKVEIANKTQHKKFINFILEKRKKLQTQSSAVHQQDLQKQLVSDKQKN